MPDMSSYQIIWSPTAKVSYYSILEYLNENWTFRELRAFVNRTDYVIKHIQLNPLLYSFSKKSGTHKCVLVKQVSLFYRINGDFVELLVFWDTRQNPAKISLLP